MKEVIFMQVKLGHKNALFQWNLNSYIEIYDIWYATKMLVAKY